jgi:hypothetical protein
MAPAIDWRDEDQLKAQGLADRDVARQAGIPRGTFHQEWRKREPTGVTVRMRTSTMWTSAPSWCGSSRPSCRPAKWCGAGHGSGNSYVLGS